jgi:hypothetical protein
VALRKGNNPNGRTRSSGKSKDDFGQSEDNLRQPKDDRREPGNDQKEPSQFGFNLEKSRTNSRALAQEVNGIEVPARCGAKSRTGPSWRWYSNGPTLSII